MGVASGVILENLGALTIGYSACKTVLNLLEAIYLRLRKIVVERELDITN